MLTKVDKKKEGDKGVKERRLQNDQDSPKCQRFFMNIASFTARSKKDNSRYSARSTYADAGTSIRDSVINY